MPGTRTAPTVNGTPTQVAVTFRFVDSTEDNRAVTLIGTTTSASNTNIEDLAAKLQLGSNACLFQINRAEQYIGSDNKSNAVSAVYEQVKVNIVYNMKANTVTKQAMYIPAPLSSLMVAGTNNPDQTNSTLTDIEGAALTLVGGTYQGTSVRLSQRRQINSATKL